MRLWQKGATGSSEMRGFIEVSLNIIRGLEMPQSTYSAFLLLSVCMTQFHDSKRELSLSIKVTKRDRIII